MGFNAPETDNLLISSRSTSFCVRSVSSQYFFNGEQIETHHIVPVAKGGLNDIENLMHLHTPCHKQVHTKTKSKAVRKAGAV
jgi:5-methylcytosine-specific restriction endonuclease McrA